MLILVDTNVLLRVIERQHASHFHATRSLRSLRLQGHELCLVPQIHYEFWVVATRPVTQNGLGMTLAEAEAELAKLGPPLFRFLRDERAVYDRWRAIVSQNRVVGKQAHDARLVAAMQRHGVNELLTFNTGDFKRYLEINPIDPTTVAITT